MNTARRKTNDETGAASVPLPVNRVWPEALALVLATCAAIMAMLFGTLRDMIGIWDSSSDTYAHGYVVLPITLWLIWRKRHELASLAPAPDARALFVAFPLAAAWLFGSAASAQVIEQYAFVGLLITAVWALLGWRVSMRLLFPLAFLLMMVPVGEFMVMPMVNFTADFTVFMVRSIGIPIYRDGVFFSLPSGDWNVVTGCSGIRYFLSSVVLGLLYAYLTYRTWWKRVAFTVAAFIVPIVANGFRATMIVLIAHYSDMTMALGVDHFIYGWVWFGIVMLAMFWVGNIWREDGKEEAVAAAPPVATRAPRRAYYLVAGGLVAIIAAFTAYERFLDRVQPAPSPLAGIAAAHGWVESEQTFTTWTPEWHGMDDQRLRYFSKDGDKVMVFLGWYGTQRQGSELINAKNLFVREKHPDWRKPTETIKTIQASGQAFPVRYALLKSTLSNQDLVAIQWNRLDGHDSVSVVRDKLELAWNKLLGMDDSGTAIVVAAPYLEKPEEAEAILARFLADMRPTINQRLDAAAP